MPDQTLCQHLADHVVSLPFESIPDDAVAHAKAVILHNLAIAFGGVGTDQVNKALEFIDPTEGAATIIASPRKATARDAAFVNSIATRALRMEDMVIPSMAHPGACLVPTAIALAEECVASGEEVLAAIVVGYDVICKVAGSIYGNDHARRSPSHIFLALGIAAAAARLMRLDREQTTGALAHACNVAAMIHDGIQDFQYGVLTRNGIFAARLGKCRAPFPADALESPIGLYAVQLGGARPATQEIIGTLGTRFEITNSVLKPHPCTGINLVPIEMLRQQCRKHQLKVAEVKRITVIRPARLDRPDNKNRGPFSGYMGGMYGATTSLPFGLAALLVDGEITPAHFLNANEPRIAAAMQLIEFEFRDGRDLFEHDVIIETRDGRRIEVHGGREFLPAPDLAALFEKYARPHIGEGKVRALQQNVETLQVLPDVRPLTRCLAS